MSRLIVLSNRVKMPDIKNPMAGGLAVALHDILVGHSDIWLGWNGEVVDSGNEFSSHQQTSMTTTHSQNTTVSYVTTALTPMQYQHFYCGFANNVLWALLHEQTHLVEQGLNDYAGYQEVNRLFAEQIKKMIQPDDVIWVHDYHFLSVAYYCRQLGIDNRIGFFLHIPFARIAFWQQLDKSSELINHLTYYDVVGTQTQQDRVNALSVIEYYLKEANDKNSYLTEHLVDDSLLADTDKSHNFSVSNQSISVEKLFNLYPSRSHRVAVNAYPIGVNVAKIQQQVAHLTSQPASNTNTRCRYIEQLSKQQIIAVDRIDYSKGLLERFAAYRRFLQEYPRYQNQLKLLQIACPSRLDIPIYQRLYSDVQQAVNRVNQQFLSNADSSNHANASDIVGNWQAITYSEQVLNHQTLMTVFWHSDIGWVNSLKDGMNLVAKEYIAAQNPDDPGVLLLSQYAGAAEQMQAAVLIDPYQPNSVIQGLKTALHMPLAERKIRHHELLQGLQQYDLHSWQQNFLDDLYNLKSVQDTDHLLTKS